MIVETNIPKQEVDETYFETVVVNDIDCVSINHKYH